MVALKSKDYHDGSTCDWKDPHYHYYYEDGTEGIDPVRKLGTDMKPFDLEKALAGAKVCTRDGREVTEIHYFKTVSSDYNPIVAVTNDGKRYSFRIDGKYNNDGDHNRDLFLAPTKKTYWVNVYNNNGYVTFNSPYLWDSKEKALADKEINNYIGTFPIEIEHD